MREVGSDLRIQIGEVLLEDVESSLITVSADNRGRNSRGAGSQIADDVMEVVETQDARDALDVLQRLDNTKLAVARAKRA
jgi:hypothetical protein